MSNNSIEVEIVGGRNDGAMMSVVNGATSITFMVAKHPTWIGLIKDTLSADELTVKKVTMWIFQREDGRFYVNCPKGY